MKKRIIQIANLKSEIIDTLLKNVKALLLFYKFGYISGKNKVIRRRFSLDYKSMKKILSRVTYLDNEIKNLNEELIYTLREIDDLREYSSAGISGMPKSKNNFDSVSESVCKIIDVHDERVKELSEKIKEKINSKEKIIRLIMMLEPSEQRVIRARYLIGMKWEKISDVLHYSRSQCFVLHNSAIFNLISLYERKSD